MSFFDSESSPKKDCQFDKMRIFNPKMRIFNQKHMRMFHPKNKRMFHQKKQEDVPPTNTCGFSPNQQLKLPADLVIQSPPLQVLNQAGPFCNFNAFDDVALRSGVMRHDGRWGLDVLEELGAKVGSQERFRRGVGGFLVLERTKGGKLKGDDECI